MNEEQEEYANALAGARRVMFPLNEYMEDVFEGEVAMIAPWVSAEQPAPADRWPSGEEMIPGANQEGRDRPSETNDGRVVASTGKLSSDSPTLPAHLLRPVNVDPEKYNPEPKGDGASVRPGALFVPRSGERKENVDKHEEVSFFEPASPKWVHSPLKQMFGEHGWLGRTPSMTTLSPATTRGRSRNAGLKNLGGMIKRGVEGISEEVAKLRPSPSTKVDILTKDVVRHSTFPVSLKPMEQARLYGEAEVIICEVANMFLMTQHQHERLSVESISKIVDHWKSKGRYPVLEFHFDQATQLELIMANIKTVQFMGANRDHRAVIDATMSRWRTICREMTVRTYVTPDPIVTKHLLDIHQVIELLGAWQGTLRRVLDLQMEALQIIRAGTERREEHVGGRGDADGNIKMETNTNKVPQVVGGVGSFGGSPRTGPSSAPRAGPSSHADLAPRAGHFREIGLGVSGGADGSPFPPPLRPNPSRSTSPTRNIGPGSRLSGSGDVFLPGISRSPTVTGAFGLTTPLSTMDGTNISSNGTATMANMGPTMTRSAPDVRSDRHHYRQYHQRHRSEVNRFDTKPDDYHATLYRLGTPIPPPLALAERTRHPGANTSATTPPRQGPSSGQPHPGSSVATPRQGPSVEHSHPGTNATTPSRQAPSVGRPHPGTIADHSYREPLSVCHAFPPIRVASPSRQELSLGHQILERERIRQRERELEREFERTGGFGSPTRSGSASASGTEVEIGYGTRTSPLSGSGSGSGQHIRWGSISTAEPGSGSGTGNGSTTRRHRRR